MADPAAERAERTFPLPQTAHEAFIMRTAIDALFPPYAAAEPSEAMALREARSALLKYLAEAERPHELVRLALAHIESALNGRAQ